MGTPRTPKGRARRVAELLTEEYPEARCELDHRNPYELLTATILSAQTTDVRVNLVTPTLFAKYPTVEDLAGADEAELQEIIRSTGFYQNKARSLLGMATAVVDRFGGEVPQALEDLVTLPGVGRKTGNVVRSVAFDLPGLPVDTHVGRLSRRLGLTTEEDPVKVEFVLNSFIAAGGAGCVQPAAHPPRSSRVRREAPPVRRLRAGAAVPLIAVVPEVARRSGGPNKSLRTTQGGACKL